MARGARTKTTKGYEKEGKKGVRVEVEGLWKCCSFAAVGVGQSQCGTPTNDKAIKDTATAE